MPFQILARVKRQLGFQFRTWGGARPGAGRPPKGKLAGVPHLRRPAHSRQHPLHVTLKVRQGISSLREDALFMVVRKALAHAARRGGGSLVRRRGGRGSAPAVPAGFVDTRSSAPWFEHFARPVALAFGGREARAEWLRSSGSSDPPVSRASVWLLRVCEREVGWLDVDEVPGGD